MLRIRLAISEVEEAFCLFIVLIINSPCPPRSPSQRRTVVFKVVYNKFYYDCLRCCLLKRLSKCIKFGLQIFCTITDILSVSLFGAQQVQMP